MTNKSNTLFKTKHTNKNLIKICLSHQISVVDNDFKPLLIVNGFGEVEFIEITKLDQNAIKFVNTYQEITFKIINFWQKLSQTDGFSIIQITNLVAKRREDFAKNKIYEKCKNLKLNPDKYYNLYRLQNNDKSNDKNNNYINLYQFLISLTA